MKVKIKESKKEGQKVIDKVLYHQNPHYISEVIKIGFISQYHNNFLTVYFGNKKTKYLRARKYY